MARTFLLHVSLHWTEYKVDDLSLWSFAMKHAVWLYNRLPNRITGLTPLELLTKTKADHKDLLRTHVWGCPTFVLDARLQDGKKIPKWNRRSRLGQYLGFSDEHSSLVANVRHLTTGCVSPQYHCIFGGMFETVYAAKADNWTLYDALSNLLWDSDRDQYAEEEYDADGMLVYTPPPLDKVWLNEPERRNREKRLREQHNRREQQEKIQKEVIKSFDPPPTRPRRAPPEIIPDLSDVSDGDSSISSDSDSLGVFPESEGDRVWADHPERAEGNDDANAPPHLIPWNDTPPQINEEPQEPQEPTAPEPERQTQPRRNQ